MAIGCLQFAMSEVVLDEIAALSAIYCDKDEFEVLEDSDEQGTVFCIQVSADKSTGESVYLRLVFRLPPGYPARLPEVSVSSEQLTRKQCRLLRESALQRAGVLAPEPMVLELVRWVQETLSEQSLDPGWSGEQQGGEEMKQREEEERRREEGAGWTALLLVDHMRSRERYVKMIRRWSSELQLVGRLFLGPLILVLLQGPHANIKEYIHLQRTVKVDVDSSGKRCKEKMMKVLYEQPSSSSKQPKQMSSFEVVEFSSLDQMRRAFEDVGQLELFQEFVPTL
ncbi:RWD domain-containing protein 3 [Hypomesus transpacificus]|uniref:RWD domain-containing protein 3 n=1 Tax=Hypomesus transpacificus TaxID=137520 RepID=UPI001F080E8A|nr:RWD domain-containing protein 3 [Hypomesus transpacificus]